MTVDEPRRRTAYRAIVTEIVDLTPRIRRITIAAPALAGLLPSGPDEYVGLLIPPHLGGSFQLPALADHQNVRAAVAALPDVERPDLRWYTVRQHRPALGEIDVDIVLHGDNADGFDTASGPGSRFAAAAEVGTALGIVEGSALFCRRATGTTWLIGDDTAIPAIARLIESASSDAVLHAIIETTSPDDILPIGDCTTATWVCRGSATPGSALIPAIHDARIPASIDAAWVCGEQGVVSRVRRHLVAERGIPAPRITFSGYWRLGRPRG